MTGHFNEIPIFNTNSSIGYFTQLNEVSFIGAPRGFGGEWLFIFRELGSTGNYFRGAREQAHNFGDIGSLAKKQKKKKGNASILFDFLEKSSASGGLAPDPLVNSKCVYFRTNMLIKIHLREEIWQLNFLVYFYPLELLIFRLLITLRAPQIAPDHTILVNIFPDPPSNSLTTQCYGATYTPARLLSFKEISPF